MLRAKKPIPLMKELKEIIQGGLHEGLVPFIRDIQHHIVLILKASLCNLLTFLYNLGGEHESTLSSRRINSKGLLRSELRVSLRFVFCKQLQF